jgi:hypothetical protein
MIPTFLSDGFKNFLAELSQGTTLKQGETLWSDRTGIQRNFGGINELAANGNKLISPNRKFVLTIQPDANVIIWKGDFSADGFPIRNGVEVKEWNLWPDFVEQFFNLKIDINQIQNSEAKVQNGPFGLQFVSDGIGIWSSKLKKFLPYYLMRFPAGSGSLGPAKLELRNDGGLNVFRGTTKVWSQGPEEAAAANQTYEVNQTIATQQATASAAQAAQSGTQPNLTTSSFSKYLPFMAIAGFLLYKFKSK